MTLPDSILGTIIAATITGLVSLIGLIISKENKTSEFRQLWIDALRKEFSQFISHSMEIQGHRAWGRENQEEKWSAVREDYLEVNKSITNIRLRLNPNEDSSKTVLSLLKKYEELFIDQRVPTNDEINPVHHQFVDAAQKLLKAEWNRVRNGELVFQIARATSFCVVMAGVFILFFWFFYSK